MAKKKIEIELDEQVATIAEDGAAIQGETLSTLVERGESPRSIAQNHMNQALWRMIQRGEYPADVAAEVKAEANRQKTARAGAAS